MIKHIVMWRLKEFANGVNKEENARKLSVLKLALISQFLKPPPMLFYIQSSIVWEISRLTKDTLNIRR